MLNIVVLAGSYREKNALGVYNKALMDIKGKPMLEYILDALMRVRDISQTALVGPAAQLSRYDSDRVHAVESNGTIMENVMAGARSFKDENDLLILVSDLPMLTAEAVEDFIQQSYKTGGDFCYPVIPRECMEAKFPGSRRSYTQLHDGIFTGGNMFFVRPQVLEKSLWLAEKMLAARKHPLQMARLVHVGLLVKLMTGSLRIADAEKRVSEILGIKARAVICRYAEVGHDVDKPEDVALAEKYLQ